MLGMRINGFLRCPVSKILITPVDVTHVKVMVDEAARCYKKRLVSNGLAYNRSTHFVVFWATDSSHRFVGCDMQRGQS
jgi:hypothetical protein